MADAAMPRLGVTGSARLELKGFAMVELEQLDQRIVQFIIFDTMGLGLLVFVDFAAYRTCLRGLCHRQLSVQVHVGPAGANLLGKARSQPERS